MLRRYRELPRENVGVVVHPELIPHVLQHGRSIVADDGAIFADENVHTIESVVIDAIDDARSTVIRESAPFDSLRSREESGARFELWNTATFPTLQSDGPTRLGT